MTKLFEKAIKAVSELPESEQDGVASLIFDELASEKKWGGLFAASQDKLANLAKEALSEYVSGKTRPLDM